MGNGSVPPSGAVFIRRWSVQPLPEDPDHVLILRAIVTTVVSEGARAGPGSMRAVEAFLTTMRTRTR